MMVIIMTWPWCGLYFFDDNFWLLMVILLPFYVVTDLVLCLHLFTRDTICDSVIVLALFYRFSLLIGSSTKLSELYLLLDDGSCSVIFEVFSRGRLLCFIHRVYTFLFWFTIFSFGDRCLCIIMFPNPGKKSYVFLEIAIHHYHDTIFIYIPFH